MASHEVERKLVTALNWKDGPRKRATVFDTLLAVTDDGFIVHLPTGYTIDPPKRDGVFRQDIDKKAFVIWMLDQDPGGWDETRKCVEGEQLNVPLAERLKGIRDSYP